MVSRLTGRPSLDAAVTTPRDTTILRIVFRFGQGIGDQGARTEGDEGCDTGMSRSQRPAPWL